MKTPFLPALVVLSTAIILAGQQARVVDDLAGPLLVLRSGKWGFIDRSGRIVVEPQFDQAGRFSEGLAAVRSGSEWGYIDFAGQFVIPRRFTFASEFSEGLAHARWRDESGAEVFAYIDRAGETVFVCKQGDPDVRMTPSQCRRPFVGGFVKEAIEVFRCLDELDNPRKFPCRRQVMIDRFGFYDKTGRLAISGPFGSGGGLFVDGLAAVGAARAADGRIHRSHWDLRHTVQVRPSGRLQRGPCGRASQRSLGFIDRIGRIVIEPQFVSVRTFSEGLAAASTDENRATFGYINRSGRFVIPPQFESAESFAEGVAAVCCPGERTRYIDRNGRPAFDAVFPRGPLRAGRFVGGVALVEIDGVGQAYIDRSGRLIAPVRDRN